MSTKALTVFLSVIILLFVVEMVRRETLTFKYAAGWFLVLLGSIVLALFDGVIQWAAALFGFELASNFIFFAVLCAFVFLSLLLTIFLCQQNRRNDRMAQLIGILEKEVNELKKQ